MRLTEEDLMRKACFLGSMLLLTGCITVNGDYRVVAYDENGKELAPKVKMLAHGTGIYSSKIALCRAFPNATVRVFDLNTNQELKGESPRKCR